MALFRIISPVKACSLNGLCGSVAVVNSDEFWAVIVDVLALIFLERDGSMSDNRVDGVLATADAQAVLAAIKVIRNKLPFLIDLSPDEKRSLPALGEAGRGPAQPVSSR